MISCVYATIRKLFMVRRLKGRVWGIDKGSRFVTGKVSESWKRGGWCGKIKYVIESIFLQFLTGNVGLQFFFFCLVIVI